MKISSLFCFEENHCVGGSQPEADKDSVSAHSEKG